MQQKLCTGRKVGGGLSVLSSNRRMPSTYPSASDELLKDSLTWECSETRSFLLGNQSIPLVVNFIRLLEGSARTFFFMLYKIPLCLYNLPGSVIM